MADIVPLHDAEPIPGQPWPEVIERLSDLLAQAQRGEIVALAYATADADGGMSTGWRTSRADKFRLGAAVLALGYRYGGALAE